MANYKKKQTAKNSRARAHRDGWTCQGRLRYERHFKNIARDEERDLAPEWCNGNIPDFDSGDSTFESWLGKGHGVEW